MTEAEIKQILVDAKALLSNDHFILTSGRHAPGYFNKDAVYPHTEPTSKICRIFAERAAAWNPEVVISPATGGISLIQWTAHFLTELSSHEVLAVYAEKTTDGSGFRLTRGYDEIVKGKRVLVVEDVLTTGGSVKKVVQTVRDAGGEIVGVLAIGNRGGVTIEAVGNPPHFETLVNLDIESWLPEDCPLCAKGVPVNTKIGKGKNLSQAKKS